MYSNNVYQFDPNGITPIPSSLNFRNVLHPELVSNLYNDNFGATWMNLLYKSGIKTYILSYNLATLIIEGYECEESGKRFITIRNHNLKMNMKYDAIKGYRLLDNLMSIGIEFGLDAPRSKKAEAINMLTIKSVLYNGFIKLSKDQFNKEYKKEGTEIVE